jgi:hypothetical protein
MLPADFCYFKQHNKEATADCDTQPAACDITVRKNEFSVSTWSAVFEGKETYEFVAMRACDVTVI